MSELPPSAFYALDLLNILAGPIANVLTVGIVAFACCYVAKRMLRP